MQQAANIGNDHPSAADRHIRTLKNVNCKLVSLRQHGAGRFSLDLARCFLGHTCTPPLTDKGERARCNPSDDMGGVRWHFR